ncbi:hypothetical protein JW960_12745 [candidate division KSB1 bacterium]|nr:hypothetical protein [candidate division KSB1 bacterium]
MHMLKMKPLVLSFISLGLFWISSGSGYATETLKLQPIHPLKSMLWEQHRMSSDASLAMLSVPASTDDVPNSAEPKSKGKALILSLFIPGAGQQYLGHTTSAKSYFFTEIALWTGVISFQAYSAWRRDDMKTYASLHAGADVSDKPSQYFVDMGNYMDVRDYNDAKQRNREFYKIYDETDYFWAWDNEAQQHEFEDLRISSDRARNRAIFIVGGILANHLISTIDAVWKSYKYNKRHQQQSSNWNLQFAAPHQGEWRMVFNTAF